MKRMFFVSAVYAFIALLVCFIVAFLREIPELLPSDEVFYRVLCALRYFFKILPALFTASALIGSTIEFRQFSPKCRQRFSPEILYLFGFVIKIALIFVLLSTVASEIFLPTVTSKRASLRSDYVLYRDYLKWGEQHLSDGKYELALHYAQGIAAIDSESDEAQSFISRAETAFDVFQHRKNFEFSEYDENGGDEAENKLKAQDTFISLDFLRAKSKEAEEKNDSFALHYYEELISEMKSEQKSEISLNELKEKAYEATDKKDSFALHYYSLLEKEFEKKKSSALSLDELQKKASEAQNRGDWFAAHYYARLGEQMKKAESSLSKSISIEDLKAKAKEAAQKGNDTALQYCLLLEEELAKNEEDKSEWLVEYYWQKIADEVEIGNAGGEAAWKELSVPQKSINSEQYEEVYDVYSTKYYGYSALVNDEPITAYYTFKTLYDTSRELADDPDIQQYLAKSEQALLQKYFFVDEMNGIEPFESVRNMFFSVKTDDGTFVVFVQGAADFAQGKYLRGLSVHKFTREGEAEYSMTVPFAKLLYSDGNESSIMVKSVYKEGDAGIVEPVYTLAEGSTTVNPSLFFTLPISYRDFNLVAGSSVGADKMFLPHLMQFVRKSAQYGFSTESYRLILIERLCFPFLLLVIFVFCAAISWNYRVDSGTAFRIHWILAFPPLTIICYIALSIGLYALKLLAAVIVGFAGFYAIAVSLAACVFMLTVASLLFLSRKSD